MKIGNTSMIKSVVMENPAFAYQFLVMLMQVPGIALFHARGIAVSRIDPRSYNSSIDALVMLMLTLYRTWAQ